MWHIINQFLTVLGNDMDVFNVHSAADEYQA